MRVPDQGITLRVHPGPAKRVYSTLHSLLTIVKYANSVRDGRMSPNGVLSGGSSIVVQMEQVAVDVQGGAITDCGHWIAEEKPEELTQRLLEFFGAGT